MRLRLLTMAAAAFCLFVVACSSKPESVLPEGKMADVLADLSIADQLSMRSARGNGEFATDSARKVLRQSIMKKHGVTEAQFDSTLNWYGHHMAEYSELYKKVDKRLAARVAQVNKASGRDAADLDNLWPLPSMISISATDPTYGVSFSVPGSRIKVGQSLVWGMKTLRFRGNATAFLAVEYPNMELQYVRRTLNGDGNAELQLQIEKGRRPSRVFGYIHFAQAPEQRLWLDSISLVQRPVSPSDFNSPVTQKTIPPVRYTYRD